MNMGILSTLPDKLVTADELFAHPEWGRCELVRGKVKLMSPAGGQHGDIVFKITLRLGVFVESKGLGSLLAADTGFWIARNPDTVRGPDLMFYSTSRIPSGGFPKTYLTVPPDLAVEVVSPTDLFSEVTEKAESYVIAGVRLTWIIDPQRNRAHVYRPNQAVQTLSDIDTLSGEDVLPGFSLPLKDLFPS
jgi:Uma2 family endonuclease